MAISPNIPTSQPGRNDVSVANSQSMIGLNQNHLPPPSSPQMPIQVESHKNNEYLRFVGLVFLNFKIFKQKFLFQRKFRMS